MLGINLNGNTPIYEQLIVKIEQLVLSGVLLENEQLPSVRELATSLAVNPNTIQKAYAFLEQEGVAYSISGKGRFVTNNIELLRKKRINRLLDEMESIVKVLISLGANKETVTNVITKVFEKGEIK